MNDSYSTSVSGRFVFRASSANRPSSPDELPEPPAWTIDALCAQTDPDAFFPEKGGSTKFAKSVCASCKVAKQCLDYALDNDERFGIWGGLSERQRRVLRRAAA